MSLKRIYVEITNKCNLSCSFCQKSKRLPRSMTIEQFEIIAKQIKPYCDYVYLHVKGEPITHQNLREILEICTQNALKVNLTTNGTLLAQKKDILLQAPSMRQVNLSVHGYQPATHGPLETWLEVLTDFAEQFALNGGFVVFRFWLLGETRRPHGNDLAALEYLQKRYHPMEDLRNDCSKRSITLKKGIFISFDQEFAWPNIENPIVSENGTCHGARSMIGILADGTVVPCCLDGEGACCLGNIFDTPLDEILSSKYYKEICTGFNNRLVVADLCKRCSYRLRFNKE